MLSAKRILTFPTLGWLLLLVLLNSCTYYKTVTLDTITASTLRTTYEYKPQVVIHENHFKYQYLLLDFTIENDTLKGTLIPSPEGKKHKMEKKEFRRGKVRAYHPKQVMHILTLIDGLDTGEFAIPVQQLIMVKTHEVDVVLSTLATIGTTTGVTAVVGAGAILIACNCPQVESYDLEGSPQFHGSLFPGAIFKSLERKDYLILDKLLPEDAPTLNLRISNVLAETQFIDQVEVLEVEHPGFDHLALGHDNHLVSYNEPLPPTMVLEGSTDYITTSINQVDQIRYAFDQYESFDELNTVQLQFDRSDFSDNPVLIIRGKQSAWLDTVANYVFRQGGTAFKNWVARKDRSSGHKWNRNSVRQGLSLNVYLKVDNEWRYIGSHHNPGTASMRTLAMPLDLSTSHTPFIELKFESAYKVWEIDYVGLSNEWSSDLTTHTLHITSATDQNQETVWPIIQQTDEAYLTLHEGENYVDLEVHAPAGTPSSTVVLSGTGYYHHNTDYQQKPNRKAILQLRTKLGLQDVSRALDFYSRLMASQ